MSRTIGFACFALATLVANSNGELLAQPPQGVIRTFAVIGDVDFTGEDSVLVKVKKSDVTPSTKQLVTGDESALDGTTWVFGSPSGMHITKGFGDTPTGGFAWLVDSQTPELPPIGSVSLTGPDALLVQETYYVYAEGNFIYTTPDESATPMTFVTAIFNR